MEATAQAQPNIALVKYWGKREPVSNLPAVGSLSITLDELWTRTRVRFDETIAADRFELNGRRDSGETSRVSACLDRLRRLAGTQRRALVSSHNNFPTGAGLASSASGFAALVAAAAQALGLELSGEEISRLARRSSGSAARSVFGGFVELPAADSSTADVAAAPLLAESAWPLGVTIAITSTEAKAVGSGEGMQHTAETSAYYDAWVQTAAADLVEARRAVLARDFETLATVSERSCLKMHAAMMAAQPGLVYWNGATVECVHRVRALRASGVPVFFTIDAGPQVKAVSPPQHAETVRQALAAVPGVLDILESGLGSGVRIIGSEAS